MAASEEAGVASVVGALLGLWMAWRMLAPAAFRLGGLGAPKHQGKVAPKHQMRIVLLQTVGVASKQRTNQMAPQASQEAVLQAQL